MAKRPNPIKDQICTACIVRDILTEAGWDPDNPPASIDAIKSDLKVHGEAFVRRLLRPEVWNSLNARGRTEELMPIDGLEAMLRGYDGLPVVVVEGKMYRPKDSPTSK